jgi:hypothetical protein
MSEGMLSMVVSKMKIWLMRFAVTSLLCGACACFYLQPTQAQEQSGEGPLTNAAIIKLVRAGFKEKTVIAIIRTRPTRFDLAPDRLIELKRNGVSENVILAMLARDETIFMSDEGWGDDPFFGDPNGSKRAGQPGGTSDGSTDIFGSGGSSSSRTRGRGMSGGNEGDTQTTGSATVRILRPPAEEGGAPKLEKTPTLTNQSIIELVEAGFSEGTIIRRIEQSPADFDLSPAKLAELRKRRVSDPIIAAMTAAMGDDSTSRTQ